jgi:hypothetical protein
VVSRANHQQYRHPPCPSSSRLPLLSMAPIPASTRLYTLAPLHLHLVGSLKLGSGGARVDAILQVTSAHLNKSKREKAKVEREGKKRHAGVRRLWEGDEG